MGWEILPWYTLTDDFDTDFDVGEWHGTNVFYRDDDDRIFRTYFVDGRGDEALGGTWAYLDITALGRQEDWEDSPEGYPQSPANVWLRRHDEYDAPAGSEAAEAMAVQVERGRAAGQTKSSGAVIAHVGGVPVEEALLPSVSGTVRRCCWRVPGSFAPGTRSPVVRPACGRAMDFRPSLDLCS